MFGKIGYINVNLKIKFILDFTPNYAWVLNGKCFNMRTGKFIKQTRNNGSIGYVINGKFMSCNSLKSHLIKQK